jgi:adenine/guanine phosphoribosyltransferase-like PRPP-binding protein
MKPEKRYWEKIQLLYGLRLSLQRYQSSRKLFQSLEQYIITNHKLKISYSQLNRYLQGIADIPAKKIEVIRSFLLDEIDITKDLILPGITVDIPEDKKNPIQIELTSFIKSTSALNFLAYYLSVNEGLEEKFDAILTHPEAIPIAISFSQALNIPWYSVEFTRRSGDPITEYPYVIEQEHVSTVFFSKKENRIMNKRMLIISDYIRKGGLLDILFKVVDDNHGEVSFLIAIIGIGHIWKRFSTELEGQLKVCHIV